MNEFFKKMLPMLGTAISTANPIAGIAVAAISQALGVDSSDKAVLEKAIKSATPDQILALKKAEAEFTIKMQELGFNNVRDLEAIAASDRDSARKREIEIKDSTPAVLAYVVTVGFFGVLAYVLVYGTPVEGGDALLVMLGSLGTAWAGIITYFFGSSAGSAKKDSTIAGLSK
jgi:hypothetical protein